jgi:hypothetical protein
MKILLTALAGLFIIIGCKNPAPTGIELEHDERLIARWRETTQDTFYVDFNPDGSYEIFAGPKTGLAPNDTLETGEWHTDYGQILFKVSIRRKQFDFTRNKYLEYRANYVITNNSLSLFGRLFDKIF